EEEDAEHAGMAIAKPAARRVDRQSRAGADPRGDQRPAAALLAEAEVLEADDDADRERVVDLDDVDVLGTEAGLLVGRLAGAHGGGFGVARHRAHVTMVMTL